MYNYIPDRLFEDALKYIELPDIKNPLIENTFKRKCDYNLCTIYGCIDFNNVFNMPRSHCPRCGKKTEFGLGFDDEWVKPHDGYENEEIEMIE